MKTDNQLHFEAIVQTFPDAELGKMFGKQCGKIGKKAFVAFFQDEMVFRIGREEVAALVEKYPGAQNWDPSGKGRPMKDWLQVPGIYRADWEKLAGRSVGFLDQVK
ncbi:MAG: hypothetical protein AAF206_11950 [Bacteroidota bacterium]